MDMHLPGARSHLPEPPPLPHPRPAQRVQVRSVHDENVTFEFGDDHVLASGEEVTVYSGKKNAKRKLAGNTLFWTQR